MTLIFQYGRFTPFFGKGIKLQKLEFKLHSPTEQQPDFHLG